MKNAFIETKLFVQLELDLYGGKFVFGPFEDEEAAQSFIDSKVYKKTLETHPDEIKIVQLECVLKDEKYFVLDEVMNTVHNA